MSQRAGSFELVHQHAGSRPHSEEVVIKPMGFVFRKRLFETGKGLVDVVVDKCIEFFRNEEMKKAQVTVKQTQPPPPQRSDRNPPSSSSSSGYRAVNSSNSYGSSHDSTYDSRPSYSGRSRDDYDRSRDRSSRDGYYERR